MDVPALRRQVAGLFPGYFALVMATGILAIATYRLGMEDLGRGFLWVSLAAYVVLVILNLARVALYPRRLIEDLTSHSRGPGFFTWVAGTCVLGSALLLVAGQAGPAVGFFIAGAALWIGIIYAFLTAVTIREEKPSLETGINGAWLIATVATQSVATLGTLLSPRLGAHQPVLLFVCLCLYLLGCMLYLSIITLIFFRLTFVRLPIEAMTPPYWINMGAVAITTLAGSTLMVHAEGWSFLAELTPFLRGFTLFFWATATWWIPLLFILGIWRHVYRRFPLRYDPQYWGMVFPLGMYTACTWQLARATGISFLLPIPRAFIWIALAAWVLSFLAMLLHLFREGRQAFGPGNGRQRA